MAIKGKIDQISQSTQTQAANAAQSSVTNEAASAKSQAVVPVAENKTEKNPVVEYIKTDEFQALSAKEQLKALKKKFPDISEEQLIATLNTVKSTIETKQQTALPSETSETLPKSEEEQAIDKIAQELKSSGKKDPTIDDVAKYLSSIPEKDRTEEQNKILKYINDFSKKDTKSLPKEEIARIILENGDALENLIPKEVVQSEQWQNKSPMEKLDARADAIMNKIVPGFEKIQNDEVKNHYRELFYNRIGEVVVDGWDKLDDSQKEFTIQNVALLVDATEHSDYSIKDLLTVSENGKISVNKKVAQDMSNKYITDKVFQKFTDDKSINVMDEKWTKLSAEEQLDKIADSIISGIDKNYAKLPQKDKIQRREQWIESFAQQMYDDWNNLNAEEKTSRKRLFAKELSAIKACEISPSEYFNADAKTRVNTIQSYEKDANIKSNAFKDLQYETIKRLNKKSGKIGMGVTEKDMLDTLKMKKKQGIKLSEDEQRIYNHLEKKQKHYKTNAEHLPYEQTQDCIIETKCNGNVKKYVKDYVLKDRTLAEVKNDEKYLRGILSEIQSEELAVEICIQLGIDPSKYLTENQNIDRAVSGMIDGDVEKINEANRGFHNLGLDNRVNQTTMSVPQEIKEHSKRLDYATATASLDTKYTEAIAASWNDTRYVTTAEAKSLGYDFNTSDKVSDASKSTFTKAFIETAQNDSIRVEYAKEFSTINNAAVTEGLAAASSSVTDPSYQKQYNGYVETATKQYSPEQQAVIRNAQQTGQISQETLSKTTPPATANSSPNRSSENISNNNNASSVKSTSNQSVESPAVRTSNVSEVVKGTARDSAVGTTYSTPVISKSDAQKIKASNESIKQDALDNVAKVKQNIDNSIKEWEGKHKKTKLSDEDKTVLKTEVAISAAVDALDSSEYTESEKQRIIKSLKKASSIGEVYDILVSALGSKVEEKFIEILASNGSSTRIMSFINSRSGDSSIVKKLYLRCTSTSVKKELLGLLSPDEITSLLRDGKINDINSVPYKVRLNYIRGLIESGALSYEEFRLHYAQYLDDFDRNTYTMMYNQKQNQQNSDLSLEIPTNNNVQTSKPKTTPHGMTTKGTAFAPVSNNIYEDTFIPVAQNDKNEGAPIGMNDKTLTVGSAEWNMKYNKSNVPTTAFTMNALEEDEEDFGLNMSSGHMPNWKRKGRKPFNHLT